jgi:hypothetical protein
MIEYHPQDEEEFELPSPRLEYMARFTVDCGSLAYLQTRGYRDR